MYTNIALALAPLLYLARADVSLDRDDIPRACDAICDPIVELTRKCDTDLRGDRDREEDRLEAQCVCTNDSFDVGRIAALCADCIRQNWRDNDDDDDDDDQRDHMEDIDDILYTCGFSSTSYVASSASAIVASITVEATRPTDANQLTTTIVGGTAARGTDSAATATRNSNDNTDDNSASATNDSSSPDETNAAAGLAPYGVGAAVVGAALMLA
ncbi:hypothetical protein NW754_007275 [Fusarium falciforme]|uniref:Protein CAP22 n=1 Tax=Fusarium falciforme TaxID=195108 RepID=A0A9W8R146_9HYPO|nr:Hypothetical protein NCS54_00488600 [Fusarium falciforme]KAJ4171130.1 hypothetical protein NW754_007275 [Fusarium falciforme]KAJ4184818.1 hypothetical protein NW755_008730 [Fusarium falciforme]KAJ4206160.1 hypothetical protein NW767_003408 [Fusarium falciforme]KAJ4249312.1 hypothetical protein NW757_007890 [Fusarium falciforme]WAO87573.1 Hypothetical protein NCS54_00488600 [Fusarium falciforme]